MPETDALQRIARLFKIVTLVRSHASSLPLGRGVLAEACLCSERTIQRDMELLAEAGIPITYNFSRCAYALPETGWVFPVLSLTAEDALALALVRGIVGRGMPHQQALLATLEKLTASLSPALRLLFQQAASALEPGQPVRDYSRAPLSLLAEAVQAQETVELDYFSRSAGQRTRRCVDPYVVEAREGLFWELHGWCHSRQALRTFALDQVREARVTGEPFALRAVEWAEFSQARGIVGGLRGGRPIDVRVRFSAEVAAYASSRRWPAGLTLSPAPDGTALLTGGAQGTGGIIKEVLPWRRHAVVEGGAELRAAMAEEVRAMAALYDQK